MVVEKIYGREADMYRVTKLVTKTNRPEWTLQEFVLEKKQSSISSCLHWPLARADVRYQAVVQ